MLAILKETYRVIPEEDKYIRTFIDNLIGYSAHSGAIIGLADKHANASKPNAESQDSQERKRIISKIQETVFAKAPINDTSRKHLLDCLKKMQPKVMPEQCDPVECPI